MNLITAFPSCKAFLFPIGYNSNSSAQHRIIWTLSTSPVSSLMPQFHTLFLQTWSLITFSRQADGSLLLFLPQKLFSFLCTWIVPPKFTSDENYHDTEFDHFIFFAFSCPDKIGTLDTIKSYLYYFSYYNIFHLFRFCFFLLDSEFSKGSSG